MSAEDLLARLEGLRRTGTDRYMARCPAHGDRSPSLSVREDSDGLVLVKCFAGCDTRDVLAAVGLEMANLFSDGHRRPRTDPGKRGSPLVRDGRSDGLAPFDLTLWRSCVDLRGKVGEYYLTARGCALPPPDGHLRYHRDLHHAPSGYSGPALVGLVTDAATGRPLTLHRTWILPDGKKAPVNPPRMLLGGHSKAGGVIRLWPDDVVTSGLAIGEGIETALTMAHAFVPVWAAIDAGNLAMLPPLLGIEALTIAVDHDRAGIDASTACADRWTRAGTEVRLAMPPRLGDDLNDLVTAQ